MDSTILTRRTLLGQRRTHGGALLAACGQRQITRRRYRLRGAE